MTSKASIRREQGEQLHLGANASYRARATLRNIADALAADNNSAVGNAAHDLLALCSDLSTAAQAILDGAHAIKAIEDEAAAQRQAEIDHSELLGVMGDIVMSAAPYPANDIQIRQNERA